MNARHLRKVLSEYEPRRSANHASPLRAPTGCDVAAAQREVIHAEHLHVADLGVGHPPDHAQQRAAAHEHPE